jgi:N-acylneuraminate cytidylyltransferase/CMP-N,N'-diacetyllegionaminic acid synthase
MIGAKSVLALIPARSGSKGLPGKNIRPLAGKPLLAWPIEAAKASKFVDRVILSTDDPAYAEIGRRHGAETPFLRPAEMASDQAASIDFILHAIDALEAEGDLYHYVIVLEPTSPLTEASDVDGALAALDGGPPEAEAVVAVTQMVTNHPAYGMRVDENGLISPLAANGFSNLPRRQDLEALFCLDGSLYLSTVAALRRERGFCHGRTIAYPMARHKSFEVDDLVDFLCIEAVMNHLDEIRRAEPPAESKQGR